MKTCMEWPEDTLLAAYPALHASVMEQIIEPFSSVEEARAFWDTTGCSLVIIEKGHDAPRNVIPEEHHERIGKLVARVF